MTEREKIAQIIAEHLCPQGKAHKTIYGAERRCYSRDNFAECEKVSECVDALIAAGIGDISDLEVKCEVLQRDVDNLTSAMEEGAEELQEAQSRVLVTERALRYACWDLTQCYGAKVRQEWADLKAAQYKNKAEKELAEEGKE